MRTGWSPLTTLVILGLEVSAVGYTTVSEGSYDEGERGNGI